MLKSLVVATVSLALMGGTAVVAQEVPDPANAVVAAPITAPKVTREDVVAACAAQGADAAACKAKVLAYVEFLKATGATPDALNASIQDLVIALGEAAAALPPTVFAEVKLVVNQAIQAAADQVVGNPELVAGLKEIGATVEDAGDPGDLGDLGDIGEDPASAA